MTTLVPPDYLEKLRKQVEANQTTFNIKTIFAGLTEEEIEDVVKRILKSVDEAMHRHFRPRKHIKIEGVEL